LAFLHQKIGSIKNTLDAAAIPAARKADLKGNVSKLEDQLREAKKKMGKENIQKAVKTAIDAAEAAVSEGKPFCVIHVDVGLDTTAVREADRFKGLPIMVFSTDEASNKAVILCGCTSGRTRWVQGVGLAYAFNRTTQGERRRRQEWSCPGPGK